MIRTATIALLCVVAGASAVGCAALPLGPSETSSAPAEQAADTRDASCDIVAAEWGWALDPWRDLRVGSESGRNDFTQMQLDHREMITELQDVADRTTDADVRAVLDTTIQVHEKYVEEVWPVLITLPKGFVVDLNDPTNTLVVLGETTAAYDRELLDADVARYDLCGPVQDGQTGAQACTIVNEDWVDGGLVFNSAADKTAKQDIDEGIALGADALGQLKDALVQVTVPEVLDELVVMYGAYETFYEEQFFIAPTAEESAQMSEEEWAEYVATAEELFAAWDGTLLAGEEKLATYCGGVE
ncbi:hypothetical protein ACWGJP_03510 [Microbacterium sp. NPDC055903]